MKNDLLAQLKHTYTTQYQLLQNPETWCQGAEQLANTKDDLAVLLLIEIYLIPIEESKKCLLRAMQKIVESTVIKKLWEIDNSEVKKLTIHLMRLFPNENYLTILYQALKDKNHPVLIVRALTTQIRSEKWEQTMFKCLDVVSGELQKKLLAELKESTSTAVHKKIKDWELGAMKE